MTIFDNSDYSAWRQQRLAALSATLGSHWLLEKSVLELGGGDGLMSEQLIGLGAKTLVMLEARQSYVNLAVEKGIHAEQHDLDVYPWPLADLKYDVVFSTGIIYHLGDPAAAIVESIKRCNELLILETEVVDSDHESAEILLESVTAEDDGVGHYGMRLSPSYIEALVLSYGWDPVEVSVPDRPGSGHHYDWQPVYDGKSRRNMKRKMWACRPRKS